MMATYKVEITAEDIQNATTFTSLSIKEVVARAIARLCIEPVEIISDDGEPLPTMFRENRKLRQQFQMGILANLLGREITLQKLKIRTDDGVEEKALAWCMDEDEYNEWAGSHVINQLERLKKGADKELANRVFDFLYDYKAIEMMISGAIRDELEAHNDLFNRAMQYFSVTATNAAMGELMKKTLDSADFKKEGEANG